MSGNIDSTDIIIPTNEVKITFTSDKVIEDNGFLIIYQFISNHFPPGKKKCTNPIVLWVINLFIAATGCYHDNILLTNSSGGFTSAGYPQNYPNNLWCRWQIVSKDNHIIRLHIHDFQTYGDNDKLLLYTANQRQSVLYGI